MICLIRYCGEIKCNQLGINYNFPHYSTILGSLLSVYHRFKETPKFPRIDMLDLSRELNIKISLLRDIDNSNFQSMEYTQYRNLEKKIKKDGNIYSPANKFLMKGTYYILIDSENEDFIKSITRFPIKIGSNDGTIVDYSLEFFETINSFFDKYNNKLEFLKQKDETFLTGPEFSLDEIELCLVSQIQRKNLKIFCQGLYGHFEWDQVDDLFGIHFINYSDIYEKTKEMIDENIEKINKG